ncbi:unnamed protein product [Leptidea sinapis]|uniref:Uncharacterized protein n=1 Tax=Leptidea sinapis TaxID=189913 RepID=A0A5E4PWF1_9NEOP|nr:unnamed protein product [Leptidea sinapis]
MRLELMNVFPFRMWSSWPAWLVATCICAITSAQRVDQEGVLTPRQSRLRDRESKPDEPTCDQLKAMWRFRYQYPSAPREAYGRVITKAPPNVVRTPDYGEIRSTEEIDPARTSPRVAEEVRDGAEARVKGDCRWTRLNLLDLRLLSDIKDSKAFETAKSVSVTCGVKWSLLKIFGYILDALSDPMDYALIC